MVEWNKSLEGEPLTEGKRPSYLRDNMYNLQAMLLNVKNTKKSITIGSKVPQWLLDLCSLLDAQAIHDDDHSDDDVLRDGNVCSHALVVAQPQHRSNQSAKTQFFAKAKANPQRRCILRRVTSDSSTATTLYSEPGPREAPIATPKRDAAEKKCGAPTQFCFDEALRRAQSLDGSMATTQWTNNGGFAEWRFDDGTTWLSEVPCLMLDAADVASAPAAQPPRKKPACADANVDRKTRMKNQHSQVYHTAITEFKASCKAKGVAYDHSKAKEHARAAARRAQAHRVRVTD